VEVAMRDGTPLSTDVYLPDDVGEAPGILIRTPYEKVTERFSQWGEFFSAEGFALIVQDVRGRGDSEGAWDPWVSEFDDSCDAIEWTAGQPWCSGTVGTLGGSYEAWVQWAAASRRPPHLTTMITSGSPGRWFRNWPHRYGAFMAADYLEWLHRTSGRTVQPVPFPSWRWLLKHRDLRSLDADIGHPMAIWQHALDHQTLDDYWKGIEVSGYEQMDFPVLHVSGWFDTLLVGEIHHFTEMTARSPARDDQTLLVGAWNHGSACLSGEAIAGPLDVGPGAGIDLRTVWLAWFDRWLRDGTGERWPRVLYFCMGANGWRSADSWPPRGVEEHPLYLGAGGRLTSEPSPDAGEDIYRYDPHDPLLAWQGIDTSDALELAPWDNTADETRADVRVYTSEPLERTLEIAGPIAAVVHVSSSAVDTDFVATLSDVGPDGRSVGLTYGIQRASFRDSMENATPLTPGATYELHIELSDLAHAFLRGHRVRLCISSSLFPFFYPHPNTELYGDEPRPIAATQRVHRGPDTRSRVILPRVLGPALGSLALSAVPVDPH
jgi:putative CocE/NonD family hydrolase